MRSIGTSSNRQGSKEKGQLIFDRQLSRVLFCPPYSALAFIFESRSDGRRSK